MEFPTLASVDTFLKPVEKTSSPGSPSDEKTETGFAGLMAELLAMLAPKIVIATTATATEGADSTEEQTAALSVQAPVEDAGPAVPQDGVDAIPVMTPTVEDGADALAESLASKSVIASVSVEEAVMKPAVVETAPPATAIPDASEEDAFVKLPLATLESAESSSETPLPSGKPPNGQGVFRNAGNLDAQLARMLKNEDAARLQLVATAKNQAVADAETLLAEIEESAETVRPVLSVPPGSSAQLQQLLGGMESEVIVEEKPHASFAKHNDASRDTTAPQTATIGASKPEQTQAVPPPVVAAGTRLEELPGAVVRQVKLQLQDDQGAVSMKLHPASLGEVGIEVVHRGHEVSVKLISGNAQVREALEAHSTLLRESLAREGVHQTHIVVASEQSQGLLLRQESRQGGQHHSLSGRRRAPANHGYVEGMNGVVPKEPVSNRHDGTLNLFI